MRSTTGFIDKDSEIQLPETQEVYPTMHLGNDETSIILAFSYYKKNTKFCIKMSLPEAEELKSMLDKRVALVKRGPLLNVFSAHCIEHIQRSIASPHTHVKSILRKIAVRHAKSAAHCAFVAHPELREK